MIERPVIFRAHGIADWSARDSYTFIGADTLVYKIGEYYSVEDTTILPVSFRVDNTLNGNAISVEIGSRKLQVISYMDLFNDCEGAAYLKINGKAGNTINVEIYGEAYNASKAIGGRRA